MKVNIRWMLLRDIPEVIRIEKESFEYPWSEDEFFRCLRQRNCIGMVAEHEGQVVGFMIYELPKTKIRLLSMATATAFRRQGVGAMMLAKLKSKLSGSQRRTRITIEVRETNLPAQLFFRATGFRATAILKNFYEEMQEDAYQMQYRQTADTAMPVEHTVYV